VSKPKQKTNDKKQMTAFFWGEDLLRGGNKTKQSEKI